MSEPIKHHHLPIFYLSAWTDANGELHEFKKPHKNVTFKRKSPAATGYRMYLYSMPGLPPEHAQWIEKKVMGAIDNEAAKIHGAFLAGARSAAHPRAITDKQRYYWARFLYSVTFRTPEHISDLQRRYEEEVPKYLEEYRSKYRAMRGPTDPATFDEFVEKFLANSRNLSGLNVMPHLANSERVLGKIALMKFRTIAVNQFAGRSFLTSDRPIVMTNGLTLPHAHIVLPLSPDVVFIADNNDAAYDHLSSMSQDRLVRAINEKVTEQSHEYVYGKDASQLEFIAKRLGKKEKSTPLG